MIAFLVFMTCNRQYNFPLHHIKVIGDYWEEYNPKLRDLLGINYLIDNGHTVYSLQQVPPVEARYIDLKPRSHDWNRWLEGEGVSGAALRSEVRDVAASHATILISPDASSDIYNNYFIPLVKQFCREAGATVIDLSQSTDPAKDLYLQLATFHRNLGTWKLVTATSEQTDEGPAKNAIDNNPETYWHTRYDPNPTKVPHEIIIDLGKTQSLNGFSYLARQDGGVNGRVKDYEIYVSDDQANWGEPALKGTLQNSMNEQRLLFPKTATGRYLKFKALTEVNGNIWTSIAELGILPTGNAK